MVSIVVAKKRAEDLSLMESAVDCWDQRGLVDERKGGESGGRASENFLPLPF